MAEPELVVALGNRLYAVERPWQRLPDGMRLDQPSHVGVDSRGHLYVYQRGEPPVVVLDPDGNYLRGWGSGVIADAHGIFVTPDDRIFLVDRDAHQVLAFDPEGRLLLALGERHRPRHQAPFNHPTDVAVAPNGDIYVSDGYGNSCVHRFSADGEVIQSWGRPGTGPGAFSTPHAVWVDDWDRVLVADRENNRVQLFTLDGEYLTEWSDFYHPMDIYVDATGLVYVTDQIPRLSLLSPEGELLGRCRPVLFGAHGIWGDAAGRLYLAELPPPDRITRLSPLAEQLRAPGRDPARE